MSTISEYDERQYQLMREFISAYERRNLPLINLIGKLEALLGCLQNVSSDWRNDFLKQWGVLEDVYSVSVDQGTTYLNDEAHLLITSALSEIKQLIP